MSKELEKEILKIHTDMESLADNKSKKLLKAYKRALDHIRKEVGFIYSQYSTDGVIKVSQQVRYNILNSLGKQIIEQAKQLGSVDEAVTTEILKEIYTESYYRTLYTIDSGISINLDFTILNPKIVEKAVLTEFKGELFSDRIWKNKDLLVNRLKREIERGIIQGDSIDKMAKRIKNEFGSGAYESKRLINTETARVMSQAQSEIYADSNVVKKVMWNATLDNKTSKICSDYDGQTWDADNNHPKPPDNSHPNCRCCLVPVIDGWSPTKRKDNITKNNIDYTTYDKWLKSKGIKN